MVQYRPSAEFVKDFALDDGAKRPQADVPPNRFVRNPPKKADSTVEINAAICARNSVDVRYEPKSNMTSTLQANPPRKASMPVAPTMSLQLYR